MTAASGQFRMMHTMIRVLDLDRSIKFYTELLGMKLLRRDDYPGGKFTNAFVGYGPEETDTVVELTYNWEDKATWSVGVGTSYRDSLRLNGEVLHTTLTDCVEMWKRQHGNKLSLLLPAPVKSGFED